jgi:hypothetical protein
MPAGMGFASNGRFKDANRRMHVAPGLALRLYPETCNQKKL